MASLAMFASALGGIASIDVNAGAAKPLQQQPARFETSGVKLNGHDCPNPRRPAAEPDAERS
jgi:hypothetical protein